MSQQNFTAEEALNRLKEGNARFTSDSNTHSNENQERRAFLEPSQAPYAIVLSCADSRVAPELTFDTGLGEIFVIRVAGNVANASSIASIEYAVANLGTNLIVVMGHQSCGAVGAALKGGDNGPNLNHLLGHIQPVLDATESTDVDTVVNLNAKHVAGELVSKSDIIKSFVDKGTLKIVPAFYHLKNGAVDFK